LYVDAGRDWQGSNRCLQRHRYTFPWFGLSDEDKARLQLKGGSPVAPGVFTSLMREENINIIHTHVQLRLGGMARTAARLRGIPYIVSIHGGMLTTPAEQVQKMKEPFAGKLEWGKIIGALSGSRRVLKDASAIVCVGADEQKLMQEKYPELHIEYIPNGVHVNDFRGKSASAFRQFAASKGLPESAPYVLCVSRIDYQKNQKLLVDAFSRFARKFPDYHLILIGPVTVEAYAKEIQTLAEKTEIDDRLILIPGFKPGDPLLASALSGAEMFVLPTDHEPFGIVILEAWSAGVPVIATEVGGIPGFTSHKNNILLTPRGDVAELSEKMIYLAESPELRSQMREAAAQEVDQYDWGRIGERYVSLYQKVIEQHQRKKRGK